MLFIPGNDVQQISVLALSAKRLIQHILKHRVYQANSLGALWQLPNALPKVNTSESNTVRRVYKGKALPDKWQDNIDEGDQQKQQIQCIFLLCIAFTRSQ